MFWRVRRQQCQTFQGVLNFRAKAGLEMVFPNRVVHNSGVFIRAFGRPVVWFSVCFCATPGLKAQTGSSVRLGIETGCVGVVAADTSATGP